MLSTDRQRDRQTNKQTNAAKNITSFAKEEIIENENIWCTITHMRSDFECDMCDYNMLPYCYHQH